MDAIQIQGAPNFYQCYEGVLERLPFKISEQSFQRGVLIHGQRSWEVAKEHFPELPVSLTHVHYSGECTHDEVNKMNQIANESNADFILGVGGGKVLDIAKAAGHKANIPVILIPTLASNCAAWTPLSVFYDEAGNFVEYIIFPKSTYMVLVEPKILIDSPLDYLRAGIGDTIAKWYEADVLTRHLSSKPISLEISLNAARMCRDVLLAEGLEAISSLQQFTISDSFIRVAETIIMAGGMVGGYGDQFGRISGAHSIHNGLTHVGETHKFLHGDKVAYGILVQLAIENRLDEVTTLLPYYIKLKLPISCTDLGIKENIDAAIEIIARAATRPGESIHLMNVTSFKEVIAGIKMLENFVKKNIQV